jgi:hypothetical protein
MEVVENIPDWSDDDEDTIPYSSQRIAKVTVRAKVTVHADIFMESDPFSDGITDKELEGILQAVTEEIEDNLPIPLVSIRETPMGF